jgi:rare lipoprotein A
MPFRTTALTSMIILAAASVAEARQTGIASFYGSKFQGRKTASGEKFNNGAMTAAHRTAPFGTRMKVTNISNGRSVVVRINDRGPFVRGRVIDLSRSAANQLGFVSRGVARVRVDRL